MPTADDASASWSIHEAIAVAYDAFTARLGADLLWRAFEALTQRHAETVTVNQRRDAELGRYINHIVASEGAALREWLANARADPEQAALLLHVGVRWWRARDDLLARPAGTRVRRAYAEGCAAHVSLQLLSQMLYRGRAPDTTGC